MWIGLDRDVGMGTAGVFPEHFSHWKPCLRAPPDVVSLGHFLCQTQVQSGHVVLAEASMTHVDRGLQLPNAALRME